MDHFCRSACHLQSKKKSLTSSCSSLKKMTDCLNCAKPSTLKCPTCLKKGLPDSHYCSQECFKASWPLHKLSHALTPAKTGFNLLYFLLSNLTSYIQSLAILSIFWLSTTILPIVSKTNLTKIYCSN